MAAAPASPPLPPGLLRSPLRVGQTITTASAGTPSESAVYAILMATSPDGKLVAVALSNSTVVVYSLVPGLLHQLRPRSQLGGLASGGVPTGLCFHPKDPSKLLCCDDRGGVCMWDVDTRKLALKLNAGKALYALAVGCEGTLLALGTEKDILFWDVASGKQVGAYVESHTDEVTTLFFHPLKSTCLVSGSEDGLVCVFDVTRSCEDDALVCAMYVESAVRRVALCGPGLQQVCVLTGSETVSMWHIDGDQCDRIAHFDNLRGTMRRGGVGVDFFIDAAFDQATQQVLLLAGSHAGQIWTGVLTPGGVQAVEPLGNNKSQHAHAAGVRCSAWLPMALVTAGEDARVCVWQSKSAVEKQQASLRAAAATAGRGAAGGGVGKQIGRHGKASRGKSGAAARRAAAHPYMRR